VIELGVGSPTSKVLDKPPPSTTITAPSGNSAMVASPCPTETNVSRRRSRWKRSTYQ
jgi:hypothetical protein